MGKAEEEQVLASQQEPEVPAETGPDRCRWRNVVRLRCVAALVFGVALLLSAIFWLPPFLRQEGDRWSLGADGAFGADIVASFRLHNPVSLLKENILTLENDIFEEIGVPNSMVLVLSLEPVAGSNLTTVIFGVWPYSKGSDISPYGISLIRASFMSLVIEQLTLHFTSSLFGDPSFFQVLKFPGGITVTPLQSAFPLQKVQILFNFTLNFSIHQIQEVFKELKDQLDSGLHLASYENLYVRLTNLRGSTMDTPTTVQTSVLLAIGNRPPPLPRLKQLAQAIKASPGRNLGLSHAVFGKVKQIQLSSYMQHSLNSGPTNSGTSLPPSPAPLPHPRPHPHYTHNHPHQHHHHHHRQAAVSAPAPAPVLQHTYRAPPPSSCWFRSLRKHKSRTHVVPTLRPAISPSVHPFASSPSHENLLTPASHPLPPPPPVPSVVSTPAYSPSKSYMHVDPPDEMSPVSPSPSPSPSPFSDAGFTINVRLSEWRWSEWACVLFVYLLMPL